MISVYVISGNIHLVCVVFVLQNDHNLPRNDREMQAVQKEIGEIEVINLSDRLQVL